MKSSLFVFFGCFCCHTEETITIPSLQMFVQGFHFSVALLSIIPFVGESSPRRECISPFLIVKVSISSFVVAVHHSVVSRALWPMDCSPPGFSVLHHLPELAQTPVHWVSDAIQPPRFLSPPPLIFWSSCFSYLEFYSWWIEIFMIINVLLQCGVSATTDIWISEID